MEGAMAVFEVLFDFLRRTSTKAAKNATTNTIPPIVPPAAMAVTCDLEADALDVAEALEEVVVVPDLDVDETAVVLVGPVHVPSAT